MIIMIKVISKREILSGVSLSTYMNAYSICTHEYIDYTNLTDIQLKTET